MDFKKLKDVMLTVFSLCFVDGARCDSPNSVFTGRPILLWKVFFYALKVNLSDFFDAVHLKSNESVTE